MNRIDKAVFLFILFLSMALTTALLSAQDAARVKIDTTAIIKTAEKVQVSEIELVEITIEAVVEKPRVSILPKRAAPELGEMEFVNRSFENELKKGPSQPFVIEKDMAQPYKIEKPELMPKGKD